MLELMGVQATDPAWVLLRCVLLLALGARVFTVWRVPTHGLDGLG